MPLSTILSKYASTLTIALDNQQQRTYAIDRINEAAREMWQAFDLIGSLREQVFDWDTTKNIIALPSYVHSVRGMKYWFSDVPVTLRDMRPRYSRQSQWVNSLDWRLLAKSVLHTTIENASVLKFKQATQEESQNK